MDLTIASILFCAGIVGGVISALLGGASLVTFPALLATGLSPVVAATTNLAAIVPANLIAAWAERTQMPRANRAFGRMIFWSVVGAVIGAVLLMLTPGRIFEILIPALLGVATLLLAYSRRISDWLRARALARGKAEPTKCVIGMPVLLPVSIYGGYFGSGVGVILLGVLSVVTSGDYRAANVIKNFVTGINTAVAVACFAALGMVDWPAAALMGIGALIGGFIGGHAAWIASPALMRAAVVACGALLTAVFAWRYWF